jgi:calcium permeable stress-gated cation channel
MSSLIGQLSYLSSLASFLNFVNHWPGWLVSAIQGIVPPILLGVLFLVLPIIFRALTRLQGVTTGNQSELSVQNYFFAFLFIQLFLVVTISGAVATVAKQISNNVTSIPSILAQKLPTASNYFISYIILQAFSVSAGALLQIGALLVNYLWAKIVDSTPRSVFSRATSLPEIQWGSFFPIYTNLAVIGTCIFCAFAPRASSARTSISELVKLIPHRSCLLRCRTPDPRLQPMHVHALLGGASL